MKEEIINLRNQVQSLIMESETIEELEEIRVSYLGRKGKLSLIIKKIKKLAPEERRRVGALINETKRTIEENLHIQKKKIKKSGLKKFDPTIPGEKFELGSIHLVSRAIKEISEVFEKAGFVRVRYPEVEWDWFAFGAVNFSEHHPARDEWETFLIDTPHDKKLGPMLLTPHTTSGQIREMGRIKKFSPTGTPIKMINISKCYRRQSDVSHYPMFHQFEGLVVDSGISVANLKGTIDYFAQNFLGKERKTRLRPYNFPFTEPSFEIDVSCDICQGRGCKLCKGGWLELGGAGIVHPVVLKNGGIDTEKYSGFAFGWGVERSYMMKGGLGIDDLRTLYSTDLRYLRQF
jgi:phenylalanyl-tRNA synthetase alpha chain